MGEGGIPWTGSVEEKTAPVWNRTSGKLCPNNQIRLKTGKPKRREVSALGGTEPVFFFPPWWMRLRRGSHEGPADWLDGQVSPVNRVKFFWWPALARAPTSQVPLRYTCEPEACDIWTKAGRAMRHTGHFPCGQNLIGNIHCIPSPHQFYCSCVFMVGL